MSSTPLNDELKRHMLRQMLLVRHFEEKAAELYALAEIGGFLHLYIGEEAIAVGAINALGADDDVITHYRDHAHALVRGLDSGRVMAELCGKQTGESHGRGGSMHVADVTKKMWGGYAIVGGHLPLATGLAHKHVYTCDGLITSCFFGDAATDIGEFHEAMNLASLWKLPVIFVCENNLYGMGTPIAMDTAVTQLCRKALAYDVTTVRVDGMDVEAVYAEMAEAVAHCRAGKGPYFLEAMTYRYRGHSMADPELYRAKSEVEFWKQRDPIVTYRERLEREGVLKQGEADALDREALERVERAAKFALDSPEPPPSSLFDDVYAAPIEESR
ncbi:MAG TPA: pyruvate dehydrogenase (acetyl-transferring) E1 component subunit alpha [Oscillatoriaceae cyanobacterium]